jgi:uroporphyrinogen III methyltransferase / synthase
METTPSLIRVSSVFHPWLPPQVFLVGAGPGDPGLLTLRAVECLRRADMVIYDRLVSPRMLCLAPEHAEKICVAELGPCHVERIGPIQEKLIEAARQGKCVVRLKGGDPFLFGRGGEEAEALAAAGIPYEVVPGVTAALGVAAYAGIPLTHRDLASAVAIITGHENPAKGESGLDWENLARFPGTLAVYMGLGRLATIAQTLISKGKSADTPAAAVCAGSTGEQRTVVGTLCDIGAAVLAAGLTSPALVLIGPVVGLRQRLAWFEQRPLFGRRILVCRPKDQAGELVQRLEELGAVPVTMPVVEIRPPHDWAAVDAAIDRLATFHWLIFTSVNGVHSFLARLQHRGRDLRALGNLQLAAIGPATAAALRGYHLKPDLVPDEYRSENLAAALKPHVAGRRVLLARADRGRDLVREELHTIAQVQQVAVYCQRDVAQPDPVVLDQLRNGEIDDVVLTSSNVARSLARLLDEACQARLRAGQPGIISISPVTSSAVMELGWPVVGEAAVYTMDGVVQALLDRSAKILVGIPAQVQDDATGKDADDVRD